jgi:WD40 repeat protein
MLCLSVIQIRTLTGHSHRVSCLSWSSHLLASGGRDKSILLRDARVADSTVTRLRVHKQEVCGLKWSPDESQLASGGNDNMVMIFCCAHPIICCLICPVTWGTFN